METVASSLKSYSSTVAGLSESWKESSHDNFSTKSSAFVPISGVPSNLEQTQDVNVWAFHGSEDTNCDYGATTEVINELQSQGANAYLHTFEGEGHGGVQNYTFEDKYEAANGNMINPLEWRFNQTK